MKHSSHIHTMLLVIFFWFLNFHFIISFAANTSTHLCSYDQGRALMVFKNTFTINSDASIDSYYGECSSSHPRTNSWQEGQDCCYWDGVTCDTTTGQVIGLDLSCGWLRGQLSSNNSLFLLHELQILNLAYNDFTGSEIPPRFSQFHRLTHLNLSQSHFSGEVPIQISYLSNLVSLELSEFGYLTLTRLTMKSLVQNLTNLKELNLYGVDVSSVGSDSLLNISTSLTSLTLSGLNGIFPTSIFHLPYLQLLNLSGGMNLQVSLPTSNWSTTSLTELRFISVNLKNGLPSSIGNLKSLKYLSISGCVSSGSIPDSIGNLTNLEHLDLSYNFLTGAIPLSLYSNPLLRNLNLVINQFTTSKLHPFQSRVVETISLNGCNLGGPIPVILFPHGAKRLTSLDFSYNGLSGTIPPSLFTLPSLLRLDLTHNHLVGRIPEFKSTSLLDLDISYNNLQGNIPSSISGLSNLTKLYFSSNNLSGTIDTSMFSKLQSLIDLDGSKNNLSYTTTVNLNHSLPNLQNFVFSSNNLRDFPVVLRGSKVLDQLDLSNNKIDGHVPDWLWDVGRDTLSYLNLANNNLTGMHKFRWTNLQYLDLRSNLFRGPLPLLTSTLASYLISNNSLTGDIPTLICNTSSMEILDLSRNNFTGTIPECLGNISALTVLDLSMNKFHGRIPIFSGHEKRSLTTLNLNRNQLEGKLPISLANCKKLEVLDIGNNNINDTFPHWLRFFTELQVLILKSNNFHGYIHDHKHPYNFKNLRIFDISNNNFVGSLPTKYIQSLEAMKAKLIDDDSNYMEFYSNGSNSYYHDSIGLTIKGNEIQLEKILKTFMTIDFSKNKFGGEILQVFGTLISLKSLNLSHNNLFGHIPLSIGNLRNLESLDFSSYKLNGTIPTQLASLTSLGVLNLSQNALVGPIPSTNNFDTQFDNRSYEGNLALCGPPLSKKCGTEKSPPILHDEDNSNDDDLDKNIILCGYVSGVVIGLSIGYIAFSSELPIWLAKMVQRYRLSKLKGELNSAEGETSYVSSFFPQSRTSKKEKKGVVYSNQ